MRATGWIVVAGLLGVQPACEQVDDWRAGRDDPGRLSLSLETPGMLDWGDTGTIRVTLQNQGGSAAEGATVEVYLPAWLEFGSVEPIGTEVTLLARDDGTRLSYPFTAPLAPGERREIVQHVRVPADRAMDDIANGDTAAGDTAAPATRPAPTDRVMRARLVNASGDVIGGEVRAVLSFRGARDAPAARASTRVPSDSVIRDDGVGGVRLGMTAEDLRREMPGARDTTVMLPDDGRERAVLVPVGGRSILAVTSARGVEQIMVRDTGFSTERGFGVGSPLGELRSVYGEECAESFGSGRVAVRFADAPGVVFVVTATAPSDTSRLDEDSSLPDSARVTELWVRNRRDPC